MCVKFREYGVSVELESVHEFLNSGLFVWSCTYSTRFWGGE